MNPREFVKEYSIKSLVCCFSGGKDSLVATHYVLSQLEDVENLDRYVVLIDTTVMCPVAIDNAKQVSEQLGWSLTILKPNPDFWTLAEKWGIPTIKRRWCCYALKLKPIFEFMKDLKPQRATILGLRREESRKRDKLPEVLYRKKQGIWSYAPIIDWTSKDVLNYMNRFNLPMPPHYRLGIKETCLCGAFGHTKEWMIIKALWPDFFQKFVELEKKRQGYSAFYDRHKRVYAKDLLKQKTLPEVLNP